MSDQSSSQTSPKRKESLAKKDRYGFEENRTKHISHVLLKTISILIRIIHDDVDLNMPKPKPKKSAKTGAAGRAENSSIFKYIKNHVRNLFHFPMATLIKGAAILSEELFVEAIPAAWELLLETDQETAANSAALFIIASVRAPTFASDIMQRALKHKDPDVRIGAILR